MPSPSGPIASARRMRWTSSRARMGSSCGCACCSRPAATSASGPIPTPAATGTAPPYRRPPTRPGSRPPRPPRSASAATARLWPISTPCTSRGVRSPLQVHDWLSRLRAELLALFGRKGADAVLAASGTDAELIALAIAERLMARPDHQYRRGPQRDGQRRRQGCGRTEFPRDLLPGRPGAGRPAPRRLGRCRHRGQLRRHPHCRRGATRPACDRPRRRQARRARPGD